MNFFSKKESPKNKVEGSTKKIKKNSDILQLEAKIAQENADISENLAEIGKIYYELYRNDTHEKLTPLCNVVEESYRVIKLCEKQILFVQGVQICPSCKSQVSLDSLFCNKCGSKIEAMQDTGESSIEDGNSKKSDGDSGSIKCRECGSNMSSDLVFCTNCGAKIK